MCQNKYFNWGQFSAVYDYSVINFLTIETNQALSITFMFMQVSADAGHIQKYKRV